MGLTGARYRLHLRVLMWSAGRGAEMREAGRIPRGKHAETCTDSATCLMLAAISQDSYKESSDDERGVSKHTFKCTYRGGRNTRCM